MPALHTYGGAPRNHLRGPGSVITDMALSKSFRLGGPTELQVRMEAFNVFNRVNFNNPNSTFGTSSFGRVTSAEPMRRIQVGARLTF